MRELLTTGKTGTIRGFKGKSGKKFDACLELVKEEGSAKIQFDFEHVEAKKVKDVVCPLCGGDIVQTSFGYGCAAYDKNNPESCRFSIGKIAGVKLKEASVKELLQNGKTSPIQGFVAKTGMMFEAALKLDEEKKVVFDFPEKEEPKETTVKCPKCGQLMKRDKWRYLCECGYSQFHTVAGIALTDEQMTQIFTEEGKVVPVTVVEAGQCVVVGNKTVENDGYNAVQLGFGAVKDKNVTKPMQGVFAKAGVTPVKFIREIRLADASEFTAGQIIGVDTFAAGEMVDVVGTAKGKGFAGGIKRHNFARGPMGHGSKSHREPGSIGPRMSGGGGKVFKGKKLPGQMGGQRVTIQRLSVVRIDTERNLILIKGAIPGPKKGLVIIKNTVKPGK